HLPDVKLFTQVERVVHHAADDGVAGGFDRAQSILGFRVDHADGDVDEESVVAVYVGVRERLARDWQNAFALFASAFGDQLLDPQTERRNFGVGRKRQFVAPGAGQRADDRAKHDRW